MTTNIIKIDDVEYDYDSLSDDLKGMIALRGDWLMDAHKLKLEYMKTNGAVRDLTREIQDIVKNKKKTSAYISTISNDGGEIVEFK